MAKIILENTREHDITINAHNKNGELEQVTIPGARQSAEDKNKLVNGRIDADEEFVSAAKKHAVVKHYFEEGWLVSGKPAKKQEQTGGGTGGGQAAGAAGGTGGNDASKDNK